MFKDCFNTKTAWLVYNLKKLTQVGPVNAIIKKEKTWLSMHEKIKKLKFFFLLSKY